MSTFTLHGRSTTRRTRSFESLEQHKSFTFPACSVNCTIYLSSPVRVQVLAREPEQVLEVVLKVKLSRNKETAFASNLCQLTENRQMVGPVCRELTNARTLRLRRRPIHKATLGLFSGQRVRSAEDVVTDNWTVITPEVYSLFHITLLQANSGRGQQKIHLRLLLTFHGKRVFQELQARRVGIATSVHVLSARKTNSNKNSATHVSLSASLLDRPANERSTKLPIRRPLQPQSWVLVSAPNTNL